MDPNQNPSKRLRRWHWEAMAVALAVIGVAMRLSSWSNVFVGQDLIMPDGDTYYHVWRAQQLVEQFPAVPQRDPYISFPFGAPSPWPPGFDLLIGLPGFFGVGQHGIATWGALLIPLLGGLAVYLIYRLGRRIFDPATGVVAATFFALLPGPVAFSSVGRIDHHGLVAPVELAMYLAFLSALCAPSKKSILFYSILTGLLAGFSISSWIITPALYFLVIPATLLMLRLGQNHDAFRKAALVSLGSALLFVLAGVLWSADLVNKPFVLYQPSWFTVLIFLSLFLGVLFLYYSLRLFVASFVLLLAFVPLMVFLAPSWIEPLVEALKVATGNDPSYLLASESSPFLSLQDPYTFFRAALTYSYLIFLLPVGMTIFIWRHWKTKPSDPGWTLALNYFILSILLLLLQWRFGEYSAPAVSLLLGWMLVFGGRRVVRYVRESVTRVRTALLVVSLVAVLFTALFPMFKAVWFVVTGYSSAWEQEDVQNTQQLLWIGKHLEQTSPPPQTKAGPLQYGVLASWGDSHALLYSSLRPQMVSSFATPEAFRANRIGFGLLLSTDEEDAFLYFQQYHIRYLVLSDIIGEIDKLTKIAGLEEDFIQADESRQNDRGYFRSFRPLSSFSKTIYSRAYLERGTSGDVQHIDLPPLRHFRLHLESNLERSIYGHSIPTYQVFEIVSGARIRGQAVTGKEARLRLSVLGNFGHPILYQQATQANVDGFYEFIVPYPTTGWNSPTRVVGPYRIKIGDRVVHLEVSEDDIQNGRTVEVPPN